MSDMVERGQVLVAIARESIERASEHAEFTTAMTDRIAAREKELAQLQEDLVSTQRRAGEARAERGKDDRLEEGTDHSKCSTVSWTFFSPLNSFTARR